MEIHGTSPKSAANFKMIDIGEKRDTQRRAIASGLFLASRETIARIRERSLPKGDVLILAEIAGIQGAKKTSDLLPLCHPLELSSVRVWTELDETKIRVFCESKTVGKTGVEMEALCGVNAALLCIYDLTKGIDPVLEISGVRLEIKEGGKSGTWTNPGIQFEGAGNKFLEVDLNVQTHASNLMHGVRAVVITLSDRCSRNEYEDKSGPAAIQSLKKMGAEVKKYLVLPDDRESLHKCLLDLIKKGDSNLIITSGGTGLSRRDITPETLLQLCHEFEGREISGIGELLRKSGSSYNQNAWLSRSTAVLIGETLIVCLPGNPSAVTEGLGVIANLIPHALHTASGGVHNGDVNYGK